MITLYYEVSNQKILCDFLFAGPPTILVKPQSQQVKAGGIASFYCTAEGAPPPQIHWRKNGKRISRKSVFSPDFSLFLSPSRFASSANRVAAHPLKMLKVALFGAPIIILSARLQERVGIVVKIDGIKMVSKLKTSLI